MLLNLAPDHLDRHGTLEDYLDAKLRIFANQGNDDIAVYNGPIRRCAASTWAAAAAGSPSATSPGRRRCQAVVAGGLLELWGEPLLEPSELELLGPHNADNAMAAAAAAAAMGVAREAVAEGLRSFAGVPHRLERVAELGGVALRQRLEGDERRRRDRGDRARSAAACARSSAARSRAATSRRSPRRSPSAASPAI